ncbi:fumarate hydratase [Perkinsela sp. CCAP 1560/4]|nr:fumarate hydratase [Perkinsela sp. CCAP 1560/4]|eukprot:KNH07292.1 fumarate hydratase [Perkinsela sp. CCAP 1560/4]
MFRRALRLYSTEGVAPFAFSPLFQCKPDVPYRLLTSNYVETVQIENRSILKVQPEALTMLSAAAFGDIAHLLRPGHLAQLRKILDDPEASENDRYVALQLLKNANIAAGRVLPGCQDTGTAIIAGYKGQHVWTNETDEADISRGVYDCYTQNNLRYSQMAPLNMFEEANTKTNLPAQIDLYATKGNEFHFLFVAKGGGSANKTFLFQETKALLNPARLSAFLKEKVKMFGTSACPPYHVAIVIGGLSAEQCLKTVKMASCRYYDTLPTKGTPFGSAFRDLDVEQQVLGYCQNLGMGAQFGGKYYAHDVRVIRLPRHGASCPVAIGVSCSADRQALGKITPEGVFLEKLEVDPSKYLPDVTEKDLLRDPPVQVDLGLPMSEIRATLSKYPIRTRLSLSGHMIVARDIAHAKIRERLEKGMGLPEYFKKHAVYYAGPAKTPKGLASGSFGPTTAGRMDEFVDLFQKAGGSFVMLAKGNRSAMVTRACKENKGFYLGSIGGPAAVLATESIKKVEVLDFPELGMEAVWKIEVHNFPAFVVVDDKGNDFFTALGCA